MKIARLIFVLFISLSTAEDGAGLPPPRIPGGFVDAQGKAGFFANAGQGIDAVNLATGKVLWNSRQGRWPILSRHGWLAVILPDASQNKALRVRFLNPLDGSLIAESGSILLKGGVRIGADAVGDEKEISWGDRNGWVSLSAWSPLPQNGDKTSRWDRLLQLRSVAQSIVTSGIMVSERPSPPDSGMIYIDPADGSHEPGPIKGAPSFSLVAPELPKGWKKDGHSSYSSGGSWGDKPNPFRIFDGLIGFFSCDYTAKRIILNRWKSLEPLPPVNIIEGMEHVPIISMDGRYAVLTSYVKGTNRAQLFDLYTVKPFTPLADLPWFQEGFRFPFAVIGPFLYYVTETRGPEGAEKTQINRTLVALDWEKGKVRWTHSLAPRYDYPPVPGAR